MKWQDNCTNPWHGVDDAGGCARGCLDVFVMIVTHPSPRRPGVVVAAMTKKVFCRSTNDGAGRCSFSATGRAANPDLALSGGDAGATLPGGTGRDDYVAGTIAMSGANGAVVVEVTNVGDEAVDIQQGDQPHDDRAGRNIDVLVGLLWSAPVHGEFANPAKRIGPGSPAEAAPCRARPVVGAEVARWLDRDRAVLRRRSHGPNGRPTGRMEAMAACGALVSPRPQLKREWSPVASPSPSQRKLSQHLKYIVRARISEFESFSIGAGWCQALSDCSVDPGFRCRSQGHSLLFGIGTLALLMMGSGGCGGPIYRDVLAVRLTAGIRTRNGLASSIVPAGTSLHRSAEFRFSPCVLLCTTPYEAMT
jgi:hypothetical protein